MRLSDSDGLYGLTARLSDSSDGDEVILQLENTRFLIVEEQDGTPVAIDVRRIKVSNNTLTDLGSGVVSIVTGSDGGGGGGGGAWTSYSPAWTAVTTNPAIGNGTMVAAYQTNGKILHIRIDLLMGSTTTFGSGGWYFGLPSGVPLVTGGLQTCSVWAIDSGTAYRQGNGLNRDHVTGSPITDKLSVYTDGGTAGWAATVPHTWAVNDRIAISGAFEIQ